MRVISQKALHDFSRDNRAAESPLNAWFKLVKSGRYSTLTELKNTFGGVDMVPVVRRGKAVNFYVFNIGGNKYRLVASIHFNTQMLFVRNILTHTAYDTGKWKR